MVVSESFCRIFLPYHFHWTKTLSHERISLIISLLCFRLFWSETRKYLRCDTTSLFTDLFLHSVWGLRVTVPSRGRRTLNEGFRPKGRWKSNVKMSSLLLLFGESRQLKRHPVFLPFFVFPTLCATIIHPLTCLSSHSYFSSV